MRFVFVFPLIGAIIATLITLATIIMTNSAPQEAAGYAMACAFAVVPYVLARSIHIMHEDSPGRLAERIIEAIRTGPAKPRE
jgi:hypothetical protein